MASSTAEVTSAIVSVVGQARSATGWAGYPALRLMTLAETGTRGLLGAALRSRADRDETALARRMLHLLGPGMLVLLDRAFDSNARASGTALVTAISARNPEKAQGPLFRPGSQASN